MKLCAKALCKVINNCKLGLPCRNCVKTDVGKQVVGPFLPFVPFIFCSQLRIRLSVSFASFKCLVEIPMLLSHIDLF